MPGFRCSALVTWFSIPTPIFLQSSQRLRRPPGLPRFRLPRLSRRRRPPVSGSGCARFLMTSCRISFSLRQSDPLRGVWSGGRGVGTPRAPEGHLGAIATRGRGGDTVTLMPRPRPLQPFQAKRTLANRLTRVANSVRQFATTLGVRPYRVFLVWTTFDGEERGEGTERELARVELLPTPKTAELTALQQAPYSAGVLSTGSLRLDKISAGFTAAQLTGLEVPGQGQQPDMPKNVDFWYEIREDGRGGDQPVPLRFRLAASPYRAAGKVSWSVLLERQDEATQMDGLPPFANR
jgi:hypothetical protein